MKDTLKGFFFALILITTFAAGVVSSETYFTPKMPRYQKAVYCKINKFPAVTQKFLNAGWQVDKMSQSSYGGNYVTIIFVKY